jgi:hypothetical protein
MSISGSRQPTPESTLQRVAGQTGLTPDQVINTWNGMALGVQRSQVIAMTRARRSDRVMALSSGIPNTSSFGHRHILEEAGTWRGLNHTNT